jgi:hypothetical protein
MSEIKREAIRRGLVGLDRGNHHLALAFRGRDPALDHRSWIFPRDPLFAQEAGQVLEGVWQGRPLGRNDFVICADEKTSIQARRLRHRSAAPKPGRPMRVEHEYVRRERGPIWPPGTSIRPESSAAVSAKPASLPSAGWFAR